MKKNITSVKFVWLFRNKIGVFFLLGLLLLVLSLNLHSRSGVFNYHAEISGDKAGYNAYLPFVFIYMNGDKQFPDNINKKIGNGFRVDSATLKMITKYPYGIALLQTPFWICAHLISSEKTGYEIEYHKAIDVAGVFYLIFGLYFSFLIFRKYYTESISWVLLLGMLFGTNLFYYGVYETGMSHVYSFCFISAFIYFMYNRPSNGQKYSYYIILGLLLSIIFFTRNINILFIIPLFFIDTSDLKSMIQKVKEILFNKNIFISLIIFFLFSLPQIAYYFYSFDDIMVIGYREEPFRYWATPKLIEVCFAPNNGLFLYSPLVALFIGAAVFKLKENICRISLLLFISMTYVYASWWCYWLGCSFGNRSMIEFYPIMVLPLGLYLQDKRLKYVIFILLAIFCYISIRMSYNFDNCFFGSGDWDWNEYRKILSSALHF